MTRTDRMKLAKAARELASEYAEGRGPRLDPDDWCGCAVGQTMKRARVGFRLSTDKKHGIAFDIDQLLVGDAPFDLGLVSRATHLHARGELPGAVIFPLLALADELESAR